MPPRHARWSVKPNDPVTEFALIARIRARARTDDDVLVGIGDDAAVLQPQSGRALVATTDSLVLDRHFRADWPAADVGHLAAAVNLSDIAAMGARPRWALLALTLPVADERWLDGFLDGFLGLCDPFDVGLVGGNLSSGPLNVGVQLLGDVDPACAVRRGSARAGDLLAVTGTLGDAAAALALADTAPAALRERLRRPLPRVAAGQALASQVSAMIDVSDGLLADLGHLLGHGLGARITVDDLPTSPALAESFPEPTRRWPLQLSGGNDYELLVSLAPDRRESAQARCAALGLPLTVIGSIDRSGAIECIQADGTDLELPHGGWDHFG